MRVHSIAILAAFAVTSAAQADIVPIGIVGRITDVSDDGDAAVGFMLSSTYSSFLWTRAGGFTQPEGFATNFLAAAISGDGSTVVGSRRLGASHLDANRWTAQAGMESLGLSGSYPNGSSAFGVSRDGSVIVGSRVQGTEGDQHRSAYRWTAESTQTLLSRHHPTQDPLIGNPSGLFVSTDGNAVGVIEILPIGPNTGHSYRWTTDGGLSSIGSPPGSTQSWIYDMSTDGESLLVAGLTSGGMYRWTESGGYGPMIPISWTSFAAASGDFSVIATYTTGTGSTIWTEASGHVSLIDFAALHGQDLMGWQDLTVQSMSEDGLTLAGVGLYHGSRQGFIMQIPSPPSVSILGLAALAMRRRRWRRPAKQ